MSYSRSDTVTELHDDGFDAGNDTKTDRFLDCTTFSPSPSCLWDDSRGVCGQNQNAELEYPDEYHVWLVFLLDQMFVHWLPPFQ